MHDPRLAAHFSEDPAQGCRNERRRDGPQGELAQCGAGGDLILARCQQAPYGHDCGEDTEANHQPEGPEGHHLRRAEIVL